MVSGRGVGSDVGLRVDVVPARRLGDGLVHDPAGPAVDRGRQLARATNELFAQRIQNDLECDPRNLVAAQHRHRRVGISVRGHVPDSVTAIETKEACPRIPDAVA